MPFTGPALPGVDTAVLFEDGLLVTAHAVSSRVVMKRSVVDPLRE